MKRIAVIVAAVWAAVAGLIWTLETVTSGWSAPNWVPATGLLAAGVCLVLLVVLP